LLEVGVTDAVVAEELPELLIAVGLFDCGVCHEPSKALQRQAVACFQSGLKLAPTAIKAHQQVAQAFEAAEMPEQAAAAYRRLLDSFPDNLEALLCLADYYLARDEPLAARDFLFRVRRIRRALNHRHEAGPHQLGRR
jgi:tetratricopeptide (TPR) repeat protein